MENGLCVRSLALTRLQESQEAEMEGGAMMDKHEGGVRARGGSSLGSCSEGHHQAAGQAGCYGLFSPGEGGCAHKVCVALSTRPPCDL